MKITQRQLNAIHNELVASNIDTREVSQMVNRIANAIETAEGCHESSGDKYKDAKNEVVKSLDLLNKAIHNASKLDIKLDIDFVTHAPMGGTKHPVYTLRSASITL